MITIFIVDDEPIIQTGIKTVINWGKLDMKVVGEARNGQEALAKILVQKPDIVMTDIRMPLMDGIELSYEIKKKLPKTHLVFLTGFNDFEYTKEAIKLGVADYLLKPINEHELLHVMILLKEKIIRENNDRNSINRTKQLFSQNISSIRYKCLNKYFQGEIGEEFFEEQAKTMRIDLSGPNYLMLALSLDKYYQMATKKDSDVKLLKFIVGNIASELLGKIAKSTLLDGNDDKLFIILSITIDINEVVKTCKEIQFYIKKYYGCSVTIGIGDVVEEISGIQRSFNQAKHAIEHKMTYGYNQIFIESNNVKEETQTVKIYLTPYEESELMEQLKLLKADGIHNNLEKLFEHYSHIENISRDKVEQFCINIIVMVVKALEEQQISSLNALGEDYYFLNEIKKYETLKDLEYWVMGVFTKALDALNNKKGDKYKKIVVLAMEYVRENFEKPISVADIASEIYVTPNYFSKVFKDETGENFTSWLNKYRINQAKKIMTSEKNIRVYEIAIQTGFSDYKYFAYIFKKVAGYTPTSYMELMGGKK